MSRWRARIRGAVGVGLAWAAAWFGAGIALLLVIGPDAADVPFPLFFGVLGFLAGALFAGVLTLVERRRRFEQLSLPRVAGWGALGGLLLAGGFVLLSDLGADALGLGPVFAAAGAACAAGTLALARRGAASPSLVTSPPTHGALPLMTGKAHWEQVYDTKAPDAVSWYQPAAARSLALIQRVAPDPAAPVIDVGGGASVLVDGLLDAGYRDLTVLDLAAGALDATRTRLGERAARVHWIEGDALTTPLPAARFAVWHDRAVFHFLTDAADRAAYIRQVRHALRPGGHLLVATFAEDGPTKCSGLPVARYGADALHRAFGGGFALVASEREVHATPAGASQPFTYCLCRWEGPVTPAQHDGAG